MQQQSQQQWVSGNPSCPCRRRRIPTTYIHHPLSRGEVSIEKMSWASQCQKGPTGGATVATTVQRRRHRGFLLLFTPCGAKSRAADHYLDHALPWSSNKKVQLEEAPLVAVPFTIPAATAAPSLTFISSSTLTQHTQSLDSHSTEFVFSQVQSS